MSIGDNASNQNILLTKTTGIPPRTALDPSKADLEDTNSLSTGVVDVAEADFHEITVAPNKRISAEEPCSQNIRSSLHRYGRLDSTHI
jgi:hypothetical protein